MDGSLELPLAQHSLILPFAVDLPISLLGTKVNQIHKLADFASSLQLLRRTSYQTLQAWDRVRQAICCDIDGLESPFASATTCSVLTSSKLLCSTSVGSELRSHRLSIGLGPYVSPYCNPYITPNLTHVTKKALKECLLKPNPCHPLW